MSGSFVEDFSSPTALSRFDFTLDGVHPSVSQDPGNPSHWEGDHNMGCEGPDTKRDVVRGANNLDLANHFWYCAPGNDPAKGHLMSSFVTGGYDILSFSPKQYFTNVKRVCWDQNVTFLGGRKWTQVEVVPRSDVEREMAEREFWEAEQGLPANNLNLGFVAVDHRHDGPTNDIEPAFGPNGIFGVKMNLGLMEAWVADHFIDGWLSPSAREDGSDGVGDGRYKGEDLASRVQHCIRDNGDGTVTMTRKTVFGETLTGTVPGSFPTGQVRVVFQDDQYDGPKDVEYDPHQNTWHWDNIIVETA